MQISVEAGRRLVEAGSLDPAGLRTVAAFLFLLLTLAIPAHAQQPPPRPGQVRAGPPRLETGFGFRVFVVFDRVEMTAADTFEAVTGSSTLTATGGGGDVRFWKGLFGRFAVSKMDAEGTRGFVVQNRFISNGIPLEVEMTPIEIGAGWRQPFSPSRRLVAYGGGGLLRMLYRQTSEFANPGEDFDDAHSLHINAEDAIHHLRAKLQGRDDPANILPQEGVSGQLLIVRHQHHRLAVPSGIANLLHGPRAQAGLVRSSPFCRGKMERRPTALQPWPRLAVS
jgi:hypothetical protein